MTTKQKDYFSSREAAKLLGVAVSTIQLWVDSGELKAWTTKGGHRRISKQSLETMLKSQKAALSAKDQDKLTRILIVEDEPSQLRLYQRFIDSWGIQAEVTIAKNGYEGLFKIGQYAPDIILTDVHMPNMDGLQMIRMLNEQNSLENSSIIVITGLSSEEIEKRGGLPQGVRLLRKPVESSELEQVVRAEIGVG